MRIVVCLTLGVVAAHWAIGSPKQPPTHLPALDSTRPYGVGLPHGNMTTATSCAAAACHGGGRPGTTGSELSTWARDLSVGIQEPHDPHSRAYQVLFNAVSVRMVELLEPDTSKRLPAHRTALCLKCHSAAGATNEQLVAEGVGCAMCHGSSERWLTIHYLPGWKGMSNREKADYGFLPTKNLVSRISNCATCHVGGADREVNHDLIAAGHPRLAFEFTRFDHEPIYQKHWKEQLPPPDLESRSWVIGQVASLRATVELLRSRAERVKAGDPHTPWPEFSEGSCYACHQNVARDPSPETTKHPLRGVQGERQRRSGAIPWQTWYSSLASESAELGRLIYAKPTPNLTELSALRAEMEKRAPDPDVVIQHCTRVLAALDTTLAEWQISEDEGQTVPFTAEQSRLFAHTLADRALGARQQLKDYDWDFVAQRYLGLAAIHHASSGPNRQTDWHRPLEQLRQVIDLGRKPGDKIRWDSPRYYQPSDAAGPLSDIRALTLPRSRR